MADRAEPHHGIHARTVLAVLIGLALTVVACAAIVRLLAKSWDAPLAGTNSVRQVEIAPPQLESAPQLDRARYFAQKERLLHRYEWVDRQQGIARIPIDEAMALMVQEAMRAPQRPKAPQ